MQWCERRAADWVEILTGGRLAGWIPAVRRAAGWVKFPAVRWLAGWVQVSKGQAVVDMDLRSMSKLLQAMPGAT